MTKDALAGPCSPPRELEEIATDGRFDPHVHEALLAQPAEGVEAGRSSRSSSGATAWATPCCGPRASSWPSE